MEVKAQLHGIRLAPRKIRAVTDLLKGRNVQDALEQLGHLVRRPAPYIGKLLESSVANAEHNFDMVRENLYIKNIIVDEGVKLRRFMPKGFGRASLIQKKTSYVTVILDERTPGLKRKEKPAPTKQARSHEPAPQAASDAAQTAAPEMPSEKKPVMKRELGKKGNIFGRLGKKLFQRKAV